MKLIRWPTRLLIEPHRVAGVQTSSSPMQLISLQRSPVRCCV